MLQNVLQVQGHAVHGDDLEVKSASLLLSLTDKTLDGPSLPVAESPGVVCLRGGRGVSSATQEPPSHTGSGPSALRAGAPAVVSRWLPAGTLSAHPSWPPEDGRDLLGERSWHCSHGHPAPALLTQVTLDWLSATPWKGLERMRFLMSLKTRAQVPPGLLSVADTPASVDLPRARHGRGLHIKAAVQHLEQVRA